MRALGALALLAGCTSIFGLDSPQHSRDAAAMDDDADPDAPLGPWGTITQVIPSAGGTGPGTEDDDPSLTDDMLEIYFNRGEMEIYVATRPSVTSPFGTATLVSELSSGGNEARPCVSGDGLVMIFTSDRSPSSAADLWWSTRADRTTPWGTPMHFTMINSAATEIAGSQTADGLEIVYAADRLVAGDGDVYLSTRSSMTAAEFGQGTRLAFNTALPETSPFLARDGRTLYFTAVNSATMADIYVTHRLGPTDWTTPAPVSELNDAEPNTDPWVSPDERHMFFANYVGGRFQIFEATR